MTLTESDRTRDLDPQDSAHWVIETIRPTADDAVVVTCGACGTCQRASGRALGYTCTTCGSAWRVLRCRGCRKATVVLSGTTACPRCGREHQSTRHEATRRAPAWLIEPDPLSVWLGGVKYLGGHVERDEPITVAGLLFDRRGIHLRAFSELFSIGWDSVKGINIEGPLEISERLTTSHLLALGATTWAMSVSYLTIRSTEGDAIFEVVGLGPPQLHARLSRVLQGLQRREPPPAPIELERGAPVALPEAPVALTVEPTAPAVAEPAAPTPVDIDASRSDAPLEVLVVDALWKLAQVRESGLINDRELAMLRARLLARVNDDRVNGTATGPGPLLHV
jgi:hypothetical protein